MVILRPGVFAIGSLELIDYCTLRLRNPRSLCAENAPLIVPFGASRSNDNGCPVCAIMQTVLIIWQQYQ